MGHLKPEEVCGDYPQIQEEKGDGGTGGAVQAQGAVRVEREERGKEPVKAQRAKA